MRKLLEAIQKGNYRNYPLENPALQQETDYIRDGYFKMLALVLVQGRETAGGQEYLFSRLLAGVGAAGKRDTDRNVTEYIRLAQGVEIDAYNEYMDQLKPLPLRWRFALDAILLARCGGENEEALTMAAAMLESLGMDRGSVEFLSALARSILEQDSDAVWNARDLNKGYCEECLFNCYTRTFVKDKIVISESEITVRCLNMRNLLEIPGIVKNMGDYEHSRTAVFENVMFSGIDWSFKTFQCIQFLCCVFDEEKALPETGFYSTSFGHDNTYLMFYHVQMIHFENCTFQNHHGFLIGEQYVGEANFQNCTFKNCYLLRSVRRDDWMQLGVLFHSFNGTVENNLISDCEFINCGGINTENYYASAILSNAPCIVQHCSFKNCWHYNRTNIIDANRKDPDDPRRTLFLPGTLNEDNTLDDCAAFS